jgi:hypothetical protein
MIQFKRASAEAFFARARDRDAALFDRLMSRITRGLSNECWPCRGGCDGQPYGTIKARGKNLRAHRVMFELCYGPIRDGMSIMHVCDNPPCCNPSHLREVTHHENMIDRAQKDRGGDRRGVKNGRAKLSSEQVAEIRQSLDSTASLARRFGVSWTAIKYIRAGRNWRSA